MSVSLPFPTLSSWLQATFGRPVHRVALDAGSDCPNRDGSKGRGGCTYCDVEGSGTGALRRGEEVAAQLEAGLRRIRRRGAGVGAIAYFQSYSNTYGSTARLEELLEAIAPRLGEPVVALSIATRPDTLPDEALDLLERWRARVPVWLELGLEAADDGVLTRANRLHSVADFLAAARRVRARGFLLIGQAILGLPGDGREGAARTGRALAQARVDGVKVHNLMVLRRTALAKAWRDGELEVLDERTYALWLADFLEQLPRETVLHRLTGDAPDADRLAPRSNFRKDVVRRLLADELARRGGVPT